MKIRITPSKAFGEITPPPSKSYAHRFLICSSLAKGISTVKGVIDSKDMEATLNCILSLGASSLLTFFACFVEKICYTVQKGYYSLIGFSFGRQYERF